MLHVVVTLKGRLVGRFDVDGDRVRVGRHPDNEVQIDNRGVSRFHCQLQRDGQSGGWTVDDQGSNNGTFVNGARVKTKVLRDGDAISIGQFTLSLQEGAVGKPLAGGAVSFRSGADPAQREQQAPEKGYLEFMERSGHILINRDVCQIGSAPGLDVHVAAGPAKSVLIVRGYGGFQLVNVTQGALNVFVDDVQVPDRVWLKDGTRVQLGNESFTFRSGMPAGDMGTMQIELPKEFRPK